LPEGDLKGLLMKLKSQLNSLLVQNEISEPTAMKDLVKGLGQFVDKIELYQLLNLNQADAQGKILLFFPLWVQNNLQFVELNFSFPRQDGEAPEKEGLSILFLLHLPDWGRMRIEVRVKGKGLYCSFMVSDPEVKKVLNQALPELSRKLNRAGYEPLFQVSVESMERMGQSLVPDMEKWTDSLLNIVV
jgi:flagellar hook-length control protein FliK